VTAPAADVRHELRLVKGVVAVNVQPIAGHPDIVAVDCQVEPRPGVEAEIARAVTRRWDLHRLERQQPTLENIFLRYVNAPTDTA
jgi:hypothetical protein